MTERAESHLARMREWLRLAANWERMGFHFSAAYCGRKAADELRQAINMEDDHGSKNT